VGSQIKAERRRGREEEELRPAFRPKQYNTSNRYDSLRVDWEPNFGGASTEREEKVAFWPGLAPDARKGGSGPRAQLG